MFPGLGKGMSPRKMQQMIFWKKQATDQQPERFSMRASLTGAVAAIDVFCGCLIKMTGAYVTERLSIRFL